MMKELTQEQLISSLNVDSNVMFFLGAGCSITSGCMGADSLVQEFKIQLYCRENKIKRDDIINFYEVEFQKKLKTIYPDEQNNYSYYFEKCYPVATDRDEFIKINFRNKTPNLGYLCFAYYIISNEIPYILTTNFDDLIEKSINQIDYNYDLTKESDNLKIHLKGKTNLLKLHGDYNYDHLHNTEDELKFLHQNMINSLNSIKVNKIIIIGYSGNDDSIMNALKDYIKNNESIEIFWCVIKGNNSISPKVSQLYDYNFNIVTIEGFDQLFNNYYKTYLPENKLIECYFNKVENEKFFFSKPLNQPQKIITNGYKLIKDPIVVEYNIDESNIDFDTEKTLIRYKEKYYGLSSNYSHINKKARLNDTILPITKKKEILKKYLIESFKQRNLIIYKNKVFKDKKSYEPVPCLSFYITLVRNTLTLTLTPEYTFGREPTVHEYSKINNSFSNLYAQKHNKLLNQLINDLFESLKFSFKNIDFAFSDKPYSTYKNDNIIDNYIYDDNIIEYYTYIEEPIMLIKERQNKNQIELVQTVGPENLEFSPDIIKVGVICCDEKKQSLYDNFLKKLIDGSSIPSKIDLIHQFPGFEKLLKKKIEFVKNEKYKLSINDLKEMTQMDLLKHLLEWINNYYIDKHVDLVIIFFNEEMEKFKRVSNIDFHDYIKFKCLNKFKTQFIEESTLFSYDDINKKLFNFALGIYTKTIGIPWRPLDFYTDNFYLGMSFGITDKGIHVGCSQLFDGAGRGLQLLVSPIENKNTRKNPFLSKEEAYMLGRRIRSIYYQSSKPFELNNITIHRTTPYKDQEIEGFKQAFVGLNSFNLIQIVEYPNFNGYVKKYNDQIDNYPINRGTILKISNTEILVWTTGSVRDNDVINGKTYRSNKRGIGSPILIKKFYGKDSVEKIVADILKLTKMDMNSTDVLHSRLPVTLKYAKVLCRLLKQGDLCEIDDLISFQYIM